MSHHVYSGPYTTWREATEAAVGYDSPYALKKVLTGVLEVLNKQKAYERDGTTFDETPPLYTLRSQLHKLMRRDSVIVDFGGGLGGTYINNRDLFDSSWHGSYYVVEQPAFCEKGTEVAQRYQLPIHFVSTLQEVSARPSIVIASGVLSYIADWEETVASLKAPDPDHIIVDRQWLTLGETVILVQENEGYYEQKVSYPAHFINKSEFLAAFSDRYVPLEEWPSDFDPEGHYGFLLVRRGSAQR